MPRPSPFSKETLIELVRLILILMILISLWQIGSSLWGYRQGAQTYQSIREQAAAAVPAPEAGEESGENTQPALDFETLQSLYPDTVAWISCPDTPIDYPILQGADNSYYLRRLPDGTWNNSGSLFLDHRNSSDFSGTISSVYGHNMKDGSMFACLENYTSQEWYDQHPVMTLELPEETRELQVLYGFTVSAQYWVEQGFDQEENLSALLDYAARNTTFTPAFSRQEDAPLTALITCTSHSDQERYIVLCQLV